MEVEAENWWEVEEPPRVRPVPKVDFWEGLGSVKSGAALMVDWEWYCGSSLGLIKPFLRPTSELVTSYPCISHPACDCRHELVEHGGKLMSVCSRPGECFCERDCVELETKDLVIHTLDWDQLGRTIRGALGFGETSGPAYLTMWLREIGVGPLRAPVYFSSAEQDILLRELEKLFAVRDGPMILLTPAGWACSQEVDSALRRAGSVHVSLSVFVEVDASGFRLKPGNERMWAEFERRAGSLRDDGGTLRSIHREIAAVRSEVVELRTAKQRLEKMLADGLFAFTQRVDPGSFKLLCTILAEGDVAKAGRSLDLPEETVRAAVRRWQSKGKEYRAMLELVRWRKKVGRKEKVPLNDAIVHGRAQTVDFPGLLADVLDGLLSMTDENWADECEKLAELLRPVVAAQN